MSEEPQAMREMTFVEWASANRKNIKAVAGNVLAMRGHRDLIRRDNEFDRNSERDEMHANIILAYRHLEDAAMRLGKAIQAYDGGKSVYDK